MIRLRAGRPYLHAIDYMVAGTGSMEIAPSGAVLGVKESDDAGSDAPRGMITP